MPVDGGGQLAVVYSPGRDAAVVVCAGLLPAGHNAGTVLVSGLQGAGGVAISVESAGGSDHPTRTVATVALG